VYQRKIRGADPVLASVVKIHN